MDAKPRAYRRLSLAVLLGLGVTLASLPGARAEPDRRSRKRSERSQDQARSECLRTLDRLGVSYRRVSRRGIDIGVRVRGRLGGVEYRSYRKGRPLVLDCSLVVSLARAGRHMSAHGIERVTYSSAYDRRKVRGTSRWSRHSFGLAIDIHVFAGDDLGTLRVKDDYEQGLGDEVDCVGQPLTEGGAILRTLTCQLVRSEQFYSVLTPDYDAAHYNHFHLEARPWSERGSAPR